MDNKKPTWLNLTDYFVNLYVIKDLNYERTLPDLYTSLRACAKAIYGDVYEDVPTEEQISEIANKLDDDGEYETESGVAYEVLINNVWDII